MWLVDWYVRVVISREANIDVELLVTFIVAERANS
jgi:hypothetical protein